MITSMITFEPVIYEYQKREDGTYYVMIRITYKGKQMHQSTNVLVDQSQITHSLKICDGNVNDNLAGIIRNMQDVVATIPESQLEQMECKDVLLYIRNYREKPDFSLDFFEFADQFIAGQKASIASSYRNAVNSFKGYIGDKIDINDITSTHLLRYVEDTGNKERKRYDKKTKQAVGQGRALSLEILSQYINRLRNIYEMAKRKYNDKDNGVVVMPFSPFCNLPLKAMIHKGQRNLGTEIIQMMIDARPEDQMVRWAIDMFLLAFCLMGAKIADMVDMLPPKEGIVIYERVKTIPIPKEAEPYIGRLKDRSGKWFLNCHQLYSDTAHVRVAVNFYLRRWQKENCIDDFTFSSARHTFIAISRNIGIEKSLVDYCQGHCGDFSLTETNADCSLDKMREARDKVLALFNW